MDLKNKTEAMARDVAHEFVAQAEGFLAQMLGRAFDLKELSEFVEVAGASLLGSMYAILREQLGKEPSELWLKKAMASLVSTVRLRGADALIKVDVSIKDLANHLAKKEVLHVPAPTTTSQEEPQSCACKLGPGGGCSTCLSAISVTTKKAFDVMTEMGNAGKDLGAICRVCKVKHGDEAIARIVPEIVVGLDLKASGKAEEVMGLVAQLGMTLGVQEMPATQEAFKNLLAKIPL